MSRRISTKIPREGSHPERQSSSANQPSLRLDSLELFARGATKSEISARASNGYSPGEVSNDD